MPGRISFGGVASAVIAADGQAAVVGIAGVSGSVEGMGMTAVLATGERAGDVAGTGETET